MEDIEKILIADHSPLYRSGVKIALAAEQKKYVFYEAESSVAVMAQIKQHPNLDLLILDAALLESDQNCHLKWLITSGLMPVLVLCDRMIPQTLEVASNSGIKNIASKRDSLADLEGGIKRVLAGSQCWPEIGRSSKGKQMAASVTYPIHGRVSDLTGRQKKVLGYLCHGMKNKQIGDELGIKESTVKFHISNIFDALQVNSRTELVINFGYYSLGAR